MTSNQTNTTSYKVVIPFYAYAALAFLLLCVLMFFSTDAFGGHYFHPKLLALTHVAALGWGTMIIFGAGYQLIPVLIEGFLYSEKLAKINFYVTAIGIPTLVYSFWTFSVGPVMQSGALLVFTGLLLFAINTIASIWKCSKPQVQVYFLLAATLWLCLTALFGVLLVFNFSYPLFNQSHLHYLRLHAHMGLVGWFLLLVLGVGSRLIPMFFLSEYNNKKLLWSIFWLVNVGLVLFVVDAFLFSITYRVIVYLLMVLSAIVLFIKYCYAAWKSRIRKAVEEPMQLVMVAVGLFLVPAIIAACLVIHSGNQNPFTLRLTLMYGSLVFLGWLSAIILGMTFKTLPFIIWNKVYQQYAGKRNTPTPKDLFSINLFKWQSVAYILGLICFEVSLFVNLQVLMCISVMLLTLGAVLYNLNVWKLILHKAKLK